MRFIFKLLLWSLVFTVIQVVVLRAVDPPFTVTMLRNRLKNLFTSQPTTVATFYWRPLKEISPHLRKAVIAGEDQRFLDHRGFDFVELSHAFQDLLLERNFRGASTISMQAARTVFLWSERSWIRKGLEAYYTILIEIFWGKERIFEIYLNTVDWGEGLMGAEAVSLKYFDVPSSHLNPSQAALLSAILPNPHAWSPTYPNRIVRTRQMRILKDMRDMPLL